MVSLAVRYQLTGKTLRWVVCIVLRDTPHALTVAEIVARIEALGYVIPGSRAGKSVSDALRWEVGRGRVMPLKRGLYRSGFIQRSTEWSMRKRIEALKLAIAPSLVATSAAYLSSHGSAAATPETDDELGDGGDEDFTVLDAAIAAAAAEARDLALLAQRNGGSAFAAINVDELATWADDLED